MTYEYYDAGGNFIENDVWTVAVDYLDAAQAEFEREKSRVGFWRVGHWYIIHHLSVIACELFLKSFNVTIEVLGHRDEDGYADKKPRQNYTRRTRLCSKSWVNQRDPSCDHT